MASSLDRAVWLLGHRADLWLEIGAEAHDLLMAQPAPHGDFFTWLDRTVHEHGPLARPALIEELGRGTDPDALLRLHQRVDQFHEVPVGAEAKLEMEVIVDRLRLLSTQGELEVLAGTGGLSEAARARQRELLERQRLLKERLSRPTSGTLTNPPAKAIM